MDIVTFVKEVLGIQLNNYQYDYLKRMHDVYKNDRDCFIVMARRGRPMCSLEILALYLYEVFERYESEETGGK